LAAQKKGKKYFETRGSRQWIGLVGQKKVASKGREKKGLGVSSQKKKKTPNPLGLWVPAKKVYQEKGFSLRVVFLLEMSWRAKAIWCD